MLMGLWTVWIFLFFILLSHLFCNFQVQGDVQQINETHFVFNVEDADNINHIAVFLTGTSPFPEGYGGAGLFPI